MPKKVIDPILHSTPAKMLAEKTIAPASRESAFNALIELLVTHVPADQVVTREDYIKRITTKYKVTNAVVRALIKAKDAARAPEPEDLKAATPLPATLDEYLQNARVDAIMWKADKLLAGVPDDQPLVRNDRANDIARTIALLPQDRKVVKDDYIKRISKAYGLAAKTLMQYVADNTVIEAKKKDIVRAVRKNTVMKLSGDQKTFPFFTEIVKEEKTGQRILVKLAIDLEKYIQLLGSFGLTRYAVANGENKDGYTFVLLQSNVIKEVSAEQIKDMMENFINKDYDFNGVCELATPSDLINTYLNSMKKYFSTDLFARVRNENPIIINKDTQHECFLYYTNGFVRITREGYQLINYDMMNGSVWQKQMLSRPFASKPISWLLNEDGAVNFESTFTKELRTDEGRLGDFADFIWRISGQKQQRFIALCSILGYLMHDFYNYKLKCILFTDSTVSEHSEGRTGKTLTMKMLGFARSYCEIPGKPFKAEDEKRYQYADATTQIVHINDVNHKGNNKFDIESLFNDITEGFYVRGMWKAPYHVMAKMAVSTNKSLMLYGGSARDRVLEYEVSDFFSENRSPFQFYGRMLGGTDWDEDEWNRFDNFICNCAQIFLAKGLIAPDPINLAMRKLLDASCKEFLDFMNDIVAEIERSFQPWEGWMGKPTPMERKTDIGDFEFDKNDMYIHFVDAYPDWKVYKLSQKRFTGWLYLYANNGLGIKEPITRRGGGKQFIQFKENKPVA